MGSRATDTLKEIDELRSGLERKLNELEGRFPLAGYGRKAAALVAGGSAGGTAIAFVLRRVRGGRRKAKTAKHQTTQVPSVTVNVLPKGASWIAAAGIAAWAGAKLYEAINRSRTTDAESTRNLGRPAVVKPMPDSSRQTSAGP